MAKNSNSNVKDRNGSNNNRERSTQVNGNQLQATSNNNDQLQSPSTNKWVITLSKTLLTPAQESLLAKGPNFAVASKYPSIVDYISAIESVCTKLTEQDMEELRADINGLLRRGQVPRSNLNKSEVKALAELKKDKDRIDLTVDKGVAMVVLDKGNYIEKAESLLEQPAYGTIDRDPTNKPKAKLILMLRRIERQTNMDEDLYKTMYLTGCNAP